MTYDEVKCEYNRISGALTNAKAVLDELGNELNTLREEILCTERNIQRSKERMKAYKAYRTERDSYQKKYWELSNIDGESAWTWYCCIVDKLKAKLNKTLADIDAKYEVKT